MPRYFHVSRVDLGAGVRLRGTQITDDAVFKVIRNAFDCGQQYVETILLTEWIMNTRTKEKSWNLFSWVEEVIYEAIRTNEFSTLLGRNGSVYLWDDIDTARRFLQDHHPVVGKIYECSTTRDQQSRMFDQGYWNTRNFDFTQPFGPQFELIADDARRYYSQNPSNQPMWEILARDPVHVVRRV